MKLSAILVSINLVAAPVAARAAEEAVSDKAEWLKRNLEAMGQAPKPEQRKVSLSDPGIAPRAGKLKNFVPGRHLPRRADIEAALVAQQARMDQATSVTLKALVPKTDGPLTGQISAYEAPTPVPVPRTPVRSYGNGFGFQPVARTPIKPAPQSVPGKLPTLPGQIAAQATSPIPVIPEPAVAHLAAQPSGQRSSDPGQLRVIKQTGALLVQAPVLTPDEQSMIDELVALNRPGKSAEFQDLPGSGANPVQSLEVGAAPPQHIEATPARPDIGPPPFPLNLLPEDQLKEFIRGRRGNQVDAPPAYFGSWHKQSTIAHLPPAGFHTFVTPRRMQQPIARYGPLLTRAVNTRKAIRVRHFSHRISVSHQSLVAHTHVSTPKILLYPPYVGLRVGSF